MIKDMLEHSVEFVPASFGGFLSVSSNVKFSYNKNSEAKHRIVEVFINDESLDVDKTYVLSLSEFLAIGGDDYPVIDKSLLLANYSTVEDIFIKYITESGIDEDSYEIGRITVVE